MAERLLVCGGRNYAKRGTVFRVLDFAAKRYGVACILQGGAEGADGLAREWAQDRKVPMTTFHADWRTHGKKAGPLRNQRMVDEGKPTLVIAFSGGRGTEDMIARATKAGVRVLRCQPPSPASRSHDTGTKPASNPQQENQS